MEKEEKYGLMDWETVRNNNICGCEECRCPVCNCSVKNDNTMLRFLVKLQGLDEHAVLEMMQKERDKYPSFQAFEKAALS